jgi:Rrf2 family protein
MLSMKAKYAIKALLYLARQEKGHAVLTSAIAEKEKIPKKFLEQILLELKNREILRSRAGKNGGYFLEKDPKKIFVGEVVRAFNGPLAMISCASISAYQRCQDCHEEEVCSIRWIMKEVRDATAKILDGASLFALLENQISSEKTTKLKLMFEI